MNRPNLTTLTKDQLVALYKALHLPGVDPARHAREYYRNALESRGSEELAAALEALPPKAARKLSAAKEQQKKALANAKEFHAIVRAFRSWGPDLLGNPDAHATLLARADKALGAGQNV